MSGISVVSGLASGLDWRKVIDQLRAVEEKRIDLVENRKTAEQERLSTWQSINSKLLSLKTAAGEINEAADFNLFTTSLSSNTSTAAEDVLSVTATTDAAPGTYQVKVTQLAQAQKLSSTSFASQVAALNLSGDIVVGGRTVKITATDTLSSLRDKINAVNSGEQPSAVTASIVDYGAGGSRIILTSDTEGAAGLSLLNGGSADLLGTLGLVDASAKTAKNAIAGGNESDLFAAADKAAGGADLLNLTSPQSGSVTLTINGTSKSVAIDLAAHSLNAIRDSINAAFSGVFSSNPASVISATEDDTTSYRLLIEGDTLSYTDANNILETLGVLKRGGVSAERGVTGDLANTSAGAAITSSTLIKDIDGYIDFASGDKIRLTGTSTTGGNVNNNFNLTSTTTVGDLLSEIQSRYGQVTATLTADGRIQVIDNEIGDTQLQVILTPTKSSLSFDTDNNLGPIATIRERQIQAGTNASITLDGVALTPESNTVDDVIPGVTLNLKKAAADTTVTVGVSRDLEAVQEKIAGFVAAYNETMEAINAQLTYDSENQKPGGPLFGDSTLRLIKSDLAGMILSRVSGVDDDFSTLGVVGISLGKDGKLTIDESTLQEYLRTNFDDVRKLFAAGWSSSNSNLTYLAHTVNTQAGTYNIYINSVGPPVNGYFANPGDASGSGEYLTGISGNGRDLLVRYSGAASGAVGSLTLTFGVAELLDRSLYRITDSVYGYLPDTEESIQNTIDRYDEEIQKREDRLDQRMALLESQFIAMETALSQLQNQSSWLTGQIGAASRGWA